MPVWQDVALELAQAAADNEESKSQEKLHRRKPQSQVHSSYYRTIHGEALTGLCNAYRQPARDLNTNHGHHPNSNWCAIGSSADFAYIPGVEAV